MMPAYNAAKTLATTLTRIPPGAVDRIILVDDGSRDGTAALAVSLDLVVISHPHNAGYGANQKTCYIEALRDGADVIVMLHPDGQYDPAILDDMVEVIRSGRADVVLGSRFFTRGGARAGGMPWWKRLANASSPATRMACSASGSPSTTPAIARTAASSSPPCRFCATHYLVPVPRALGFRGT